MLSKRQTLVGVFKLPANAISIISIHLMAGKYETIDGTLLASIRDLPLFVHQPYLKRNEIYIHLRS